MSFAFLRRAGSALALAALATAIAPAASAQSYPDRPIKLEVPWPPGGATDALGRMLAMHTESHRAAPQRVRHCLDSVASLIITTQSAGSSRDERSLCTR